MHKIIIWMICLMMPMSMLKATEGMWLPQLLAELNEREMKTMGMKLSAKDIYNINGSSLKDAIVSFGGFCTAEVISEEGLILTNHHCGYNAIQSHTNLQNNYLAKGFWAMNRKDELNNPTLFATFIISIEEVTGQAMQGVSTAMSEPERQSKVDQNLNAIRGSVKKESYQDVLIRPFFDGNKYFLFITETYRDVRLVGAPPGDIGKFGADTDNWMWPRHTGDFSLFRIYAGTDNKPATYSPNNKPYKPKRSLTINTKGLKEGDFTMVFGFPGRTQQYLPAAALKQTISITNPAKINIRDKALKIIDGYMRTDAQTKIQYAAKYASTSNAWKKWIGEVQGMQFTHAVDRRKAYEAKYTERINASPALKAKYGEVLPKLHALYGKMDELALQRDIYTETILQTELLRHGTTLRPYAQRIALNPATMADEKEKLLKATEDFYKNYSSGVDKEVAKALLENYVKHMPQNLLPLVVQQAAARNGNDGIGSLVEDLYRNTRIATPAQLAAIFEMPADASVKALMQDPAMDLLSQMQGLYAQNNQGRLNQLQDELNQLQRTYMQAQMEAMTDRRFYPDANSTLRLTYGTVGGMEPRDGIVYKPYTYLDGVMEKYKPGDYEFDVPAKLIELHRNKDYGPYADRQGRMPVCFIASNHTTGGNSGSPALDANGHLVGLNFDRAWEGTMSDLNYDASICRNIMVDIRYVLFIIDKFAGAGHLVKEMKIVK